LRTANTYPAGIFNFAAICFGIAGWLVAGVILHETDLRKILVAAAVLGVFMVAYRLLTTFLVRLVSWLGKHWDIVKTREKKITSTLGIILIVAMVQCLRWLGPKEFPAAVSLIPAALIGLITAISIILSPKMRDVLTIVPPKVDRWYDFYASEDPVPNGPTRISEPESDKRKSKPISNLGSFFADHTSYWDNLDGFVLPVLRACAETGKSSWQNELPKESPEVDERAAWRVRSLQSARAIVCLSWMVTGAALWFLHRNVISLPFKIAGWLPAIAVTMTRFATLLLAMAVATWVSSSIVQFVWRWWVRSEQQRVLGPSSRRGSGILAASRHLVCGLAFYCAGLLCRVDSSTTGPDSP